MTKVFANSGNSDQILWHPIWVCTVCQITILGVSWLKYIKALAHVYRSNKENIQSENKYGKSPKISYTKVSDKMAYEGAVWSGSTLFAIPLSILRNICIKSKI